jgi:hypothetical protein
MAAEPPIASLDRARLVKLLGMLGSAHEGEVVAAARQAERLRHEARATWVDILAPAAGVQRSATPATRPPETVEAALALCADHLPRLTPWEQKFVRSVTSRPGRPLSEKQCAVLRGIVDTILPSRAA